MVYRSGAGLPKLSWETAVVYECCFYHMITCSTQLLEMPQKTNICTYFIVLWLTAQVYALIKVPDSELMDDISFTLPMLKEMGDQIHITAKVLKPLALA